MTVDIQRVISAQQNVQLAVIQPAGSELESILRELRGIDPKSTDETATVAQRLHDWSPWGELELFLTREFGVEAWREYERVSFLPAAHKKLAFELAILGLPRIIEPAPEEPGHDLASAISWWYGRVATDIRRLAVEYDTARST